MFRHTTSMVGPPKTLYDLRKIEAALRVTCRACKTQRMVDREQTIRERLAYRRSLEWQAVRADFVCWACDSRDVRVDGVPFAQNDAELKARRAEMRRLNLALTVLDQAARADGAMPAPAIQLALRVVHPYLGDREILVAYWRQLQSDGASRPWGGAHQVMRWTSTGWSSAGGRSGRSFGEQPSACARALVSGALVAAAPCKNAKTGKFVRCPVRD